MREKMEDMMWKLRFYMESLMESIMRDEEGDSNMVAVIVLIVIVLAVAALFRTKLIEVVNSVFGKLTDFIG